MISRFLRMSCAVTTLALAACGGADASDDAAQDNTEALSATLTPVAGHKNQVQINKALAKGGVVHLSAGTYVIDDSIELRSGATLQGDSGAKIKLADSANWPKNKAIVEGTSVSNVRITGFEIDGDGVHNTTSAGASTVCGKYYYTMIHVTGGSHVEVDHMYLHDNWNDIFKFSSSSNVKFHDNTVRKEGHDVVYAIHSDDVWVFNNDIKIACNSGVRPDGTKNIYIYGNEITRDGGGYAGIEIQGASEVWACKNNIHGVLGPQIANLSGATVHTTGCPAAPAASFPSVD